MVEGARTGQSSPTAGGAVQKLTMVLVLLLLLLSSAAAAQTPMPVGGEFQINSDTVGAQQLPSVAAGVDGGFVVVWQSDISSIEAQRFDPDGQALGAQFQVAFDALSVQGQRYNRQFRPVFGDDFETGDSCEWTSSTPDQGC